MDIDELLFEKGIFEEYFILLFYKIGLTLLKGDSCIAGAAG